MIDDRRRTTAAEETAFSICFLGKSRFYISGTVLDKRRNIRQIKTVKQRETMREYCHNSHHEDTLITAVKNILTKL